MVEYYYDDDCPFDELNVKIRFYDDDDMMKNMKIRYSTYSLYKQTDRLVG